VEYEDRVTIVTPEGVSLDLTLAGIGSRGVAAIVDGSIKGIIFIATIAAFFGGFSIFDSGTTGDTDPRSALLIGIAIGTVIIFVVNFFYDVAFETLASGRTPGKRAAGIRVVKEGGAPVRFRSSAIRNIVRLVDMLPTGYIVGLISILASSKNQRLGDMAAGTLVVRDRKEQQPIWTRAVPRTRESEAWDVTSVTPDELITVRKFLERRYSFTSEARARLAWELSTRLRDKVPGAAPNLEAEDFLEQVAAAKAARA
jgi:uncharacterized RDD family membrane protein YckC